MTTTIPSVLALGAALALLPWAATPDSGSIPAARTAAGATAAPVLLAQANGPATPEDTAEEPAAREPLPAEPDSSATAAPSNPSPNAPPRSASAATPPGQWVYTQQYGWVWMPYADSYTYVPSDDYGEPYMYVYAPAVGWSWVVAPWVWGVGPWPYFGVYGTWHFGWWGRGGWGQGGWGHRGWWGRPGWGRGAVPFRGGVPVHGVVPAPHRMGPVGSGARPVPMARPMGGGAFRRR